jgi:hypothetical protein
LSFVSAIVARRLLTKKFDGRVQTVLSSTYALDNVFLEQVNKIIKGGYLEVQLSVVKEESASFHRH